jgi:hypothetical protein
MSHYATPPAPLEALLTSDPEAQLAWGPLHEPGTSCSNDCCHDEESCTCGEETDETPEG